MSVLSLLPRSASSALSPEPRTLTHCWEKDNARNLRWVAFALVLVGLAWRCARYFLAFPIWGDEAMLLVNYLTRDFRDLLGPIDNFQVAPLLYHVAALASFKLLGSSELAVRLPSFLASLGSLLLFWRLARLILSPLARTISVGILAVSIWPATLGSLTKPYAFDLFFSLALLLPAIEYLRQPWRLTPLVALVVIVPVAILSSFPAVFVAGGIGIVLVPVIYRERSSAWIVFALYGLLLAGTFTGHYWLVGKAQLDSASRGMNTEAFMVDYWKNGFPPADPWELIGWLVFAHTGQIAAYPLGAARGGSTITFLLCLVGQIVLWRRGQRQIVLLMGAVFLLWFVAAIPHKYPYGASCRLAQHVAPFFCLFAGVGCAHLIERHLDVSQRWRATLIVMALLALVGIGGIIRDFIWPYRDPESRWARAVVADLAARSGNDPILVLDIDEGDALFHWQLGRLGDRVIWKDQIDWDRIGMAHSSVWMIRYGSFEDQRARLGSRWRCVEATPSIVCPDVISRKIQHCRVYHWVRAD